MKLYIPAVGDRIVLVAPWTFDLYVERRNTQFGEAFKVHPTGLDPWKHRNRDNSLKSYSCTLDAGTELECDRVYVRTFSKTAMTVGKDYDSITWKVIRNGKAVRHGRFWAKLPDCYDIEYEQRIDGQYRNRIKMVKAIMTQ